MICTARKKNNLDKQFDTQCHEDDDDNNNDDDDEDGDDDDGTKKLFCKFKTV